MTGHANEVTHASARHGRSDTILAQDSIIVTFDSYLMQPTPRYANIVYVAAIQTDTRGSSVPFAAFAAAPISQST